MATVVVDGLPKVTSTPQSFGPVFTPTKATTVRPPGPYNTKLIDPVPDGTGLRDDTKSTDSSFMIVPTEFDAQQVDFRKIDKLLDSFRGDTVHDGVVQGCNEIFS